MRREREETFYKFSFFITAKGWASISYITKLRTKKYIYIG